MTCTEVQIKTMIFFVWTNLTAIRFHQIVRIQVFDNRLESTIRVVAPRFLRLLFDNLRTAQDTNKTEFQ